MEKLLCRWTLEYTYEIKYNQGVENRNTNALSRQPKHTESKVAVTV